MEQVEYDLFVIGGGSGGLSCAKAAKQVNPNIKVGLCDYVKPSPQNSKWGLGGTCVNVGCIPKKLMHHVAKMGEMKHDQHKAGWNIDVNSSHNWDQMVTEVQQYIKSLNFGYRSALMKNGVKYYNKLGKVIDKNTIELKDSKGDIEIIKAKNIVIAVGGRPMIPDNIDKKLVLTSDDVFSIKTAPGKTLVVGASYVALECAGFIKGCGYDTTVMVRSILLRGFDQQMANMVGDYMEQVTKINFIKQAIVNSIELLDNGKKLVKYQKDNGEQGQDTFDTVLYATGREIDTDNLIDTSVGVEFNKKNKKIITNDYEMSNIQGIFAIGDCAEGRPELTPPAIRAGKLLAERLFGNATELMDYRQVATTVFTPLEYSACGFSEEDAIKLKGLDNLQIYHCSFKPLEWTFADEDNHFQCYCKVITDLQNDEEVIGIHYLGPNAGEVMQGYSVAMKVGAKWRHFKQTVGIHPTCSEEIVVMNISKKDGGDANKEGC